MIYKTKHKKTNIEQPEPQTNPGGGGGGTHVYQNVKQFLLH